MFAGCTSMNKDECELANWSAIGYLEGASGMSMSTFQEYQNDCAEHRVKADYQAFKQGHHEGLSEFCSMERGMEVATSGRNYNTICKSSQFPNYSEGYQVGINLYCSYDNGLGTGNNGGNYNSRCPSDRFPMFNDGYQSGLQQYCSYASGFQLGFNGKAININCRQNYFKEFSTGYNVGKTRFNDINELNHLEDEMLASRKNIAREQEKIVRAEVQIVSDNSSPEIRKRALDNIKLYQHEISRLEFEIIALEHKVVLLTDKLNKKDDASSSIN
tara:strand:- start:369 stop:1187 length:819 start_codon:yes stop_codon:yes gene_type:complete